MPKDIFNSFLEAPASNLQVVKNQWERKATHWIKSANFILSSFSLQWDGQFTLSLSNSRHFWFCSFDSLCYIMGVINQFLAPNHNSILCVAGPYKSIFALLAELLGFGNRGCWRETSRPEEKGPCSFLFTVTVITAMIVHLDSDRGLL